MNNAPSPEHYIYDRCSNTKIPVSAAEEREYYNLNSSFRKQQQKLGRCFCPAKKYRYCNTDCASCMYRTYDTNVSLKNMSPIEYSGAIPLADPQTETEYKVLLQSVLTICTPYEQEIIALRLQEMNLTEIANELQQPYDTLYYRFRKLYVKVTKYLQK